MPASAEQRAERPARTRAGRSWCAVRRAASRRSVGRRKSSTTKSTLGIWIRPAPTAPTARSAHRDAHRQRPLGDRVGRGRGSRRRCPRPRRWPGWLGARRGAGGRSSSSRASAHGLAVEGAEDHPERVDRGQEGAEVAEPRRAPSASRPARPSTSRISSLEKKPENGGMPESARPPMMKQP